MSNSTILQLARQKKEYAPYHTKLMRMMEDDDTDIDQVISMLDNAIFKHNENVYILCAKANILMQTEDYQEANAILDKAIKLCPSHVEAYIVKGTVLQRWRKFKESFEFLSRAAKRFPVNEEIVSLLSEVKNVINRLSNANARAMQQLWSSQQEEAIECVSVHPNGTYIALGLIDGPIQVLDTTSGNVVKSLPGHSKGNLGVSFSPSGNFLATSGQDGLAHLYSCANFDKHNSLNHQAQGRTVWVHNIIWVTDELIITSSGKNVQSWNLDGTIVKQYPVYLFSLDKMAPVRMAEWKGSILSLAWCHDGHFLSASTQDNTVIVWNTNSDGVFPLSDYESQVKPYFAPGTKLLVTTGSDVARIWDFSGPNSRGFEDRPESTMLPVAELAHDDIIERVGFHKSGKLMSTSSRDGVTYVWRTPQDTPIGVGKYAAGIKECIWIENNRKNAICVVYVDGNVINWSL